MFHRIDASKSTKGASKLRRDLINAEIANLRDLLPLPTSTRQRLSQLQLMALVCVFLRKANYFQHVLKNEQETAGMPTPNIGFSKAMSGFIMMMTQQGKLLYISENAAEYLGHSMEDLLIHGDSVYDVVDKQDHMILQNQLSRSGPGAPDDRRLFLCRINVSRNSRRQLRFGDQKVVLVEGHYLPYVPLCNRNESVFLASCTPVVLPETRESVVQGATNIFTTIHSMDMKYLHIDKTAESHMEYSRSELVGVSWYNVLHWDSIRTAYCKHQFIIQSEQERSTTALLRLQSQSGRWFWIHCVLQVKDTSDECQHPIIVCTNQVLSEKEAEIMRASSWIYQYSSQTKFTYSVCPNLPTTGPEPLHRPPEPQQQPHYHHHHHHHHQPHSAVLVYGPEAVVMDYNGRPLPYGLPPPPPPPPTDGHELEHDVHPYQPGMDEWAKERSHVKEEPAEVYGEEARSLPTAPALQGQEVEGVLAEPVDMSINSGPEPDQRHPIQHCPDAGPAEFCPCSKSHLVMMQHGDKSPSRPMSAGLPYLRPTGKCLGQYQHSPQHQHQYQHQVHQQMSPGLAPSPDNNGGLKYNIVDLDKLGQSVAEPGGHYIVGQAYAHKRQLLLVHQSKASAQPGVVDVAHLCPADGPHQHLAHHHAEQWTSPCAPSAPSPGCGAGGYWPDCGLQRVPDVVHQELSPYITTPTTPADCSADDSSDHQAPETPVSVFSFDWPGGEQHVPNLRLLSFRAGAAGGGPALPPPPPGGYPEPRRPPGHQDAQPIALQLPRKKPAGGGGGGHLAGLQAEASPNGHRDYAK